MREIAHPIANRLAPHNFPAIWKTAGFGGVTGPPVRGKLKPDHYHFSPVVAIQGVQSDLLRVFVSSVSDGVAPGGRFLVVKISSLRLAW